MPPDELLAEVRSLREEMRAELASLRAEVESASSKRSVLRLLTHLLDGPPDGAAEWYRAKIGETRSMIGHHFRNMVSAGRVLYRPPVAGDTSWNDVLVEVFEGITAAAEASKAGVDAAFLPHVHSNEACALYAISVRAQVSELRMCRGYLTKAEWSRILEAVDWVVDHPPSWFRPTDPYTPPTGRQTAEGAEHPNSTDDP